MASVSSFINSTIKLFVQNHNLKRKILFEVNL